MNGRKLLSLGLIVAFINCCADDGEALVRQDSFVRVATQNLKDAVREAEEAGSRESLGTLKLSLSDLDAIIKESDELLAGYQGSEPEVEELTDSVRVASEYREWARVQASKFKWKLLSEEEKGARMARFDEELMELRSEEGEPLVHFAEESGEE